MKIIGHTKTINFLDNSIKHNNISHAYFFTGPEHIGKFSVAMRFARKIAGGQNQKINPNIIVISPEIEEKRGIIRKKDIKISSIRKLEKNLALSPYFKKYKVAIIDDAERLTISAQNSLLKTLEEPNEKCILILVCHNSEKILTTVKSRCTIKKFNPISSSEIAQLVQDNQNKEEIIFWSLGRPGIALMLERDKEGLRARREIQKEFRIILESHINDRFAQAENLSKNIPKLIEKLNLWMILLRENIFGRRALLKITPAKSLALIDEINKSLKLIQETNSNSRLTLENLFLKF